MRSRLGIVSNCWKEQLSKGTSLASLIERGLESGLRHFELRQGALGHCETEKRTPIPDELAGLAERFPQAAFNLAVEWPVVTGAGRVNRDFESRCIDSASALASSEFRPIAHLRIVDLSGSVVAEGEQRQESLDRLARLNESLSRQSAQSLLSLEHSIQPWPQFRSLFDESRRQFDLKLCFDPCNLWLCEKEPQISEIVESLDPDSISMLHIKQRDRNSAAVRKDIGPGAVPWPGPLQQLCAAGYAGPILLETAPGTDIFEQTEANCQRLEQWLAGL